MTLRGHCGSRHFSSPRPALFVGIAPSMLNGPLSAAATATAGVSVDVSLSVWHGVTPALLLSVLTLAAVGFAYVVHDAVADADVDHALRNRRSVRRRDLRRWMR